MPVIDILSIKVKHNNETYRKISQSIHDLEVKAYEYEAQLLQTRQEIHQLEYKREILEAEIVSTIR